MLSWSVVKTPESRTAADGKVELTAEALDLLRRAVERSEQDPEHFDMDTFSDFLYDKDDNICGTTCCLAGCVLLEAGYTIDDEGSFRGSNGTHTDPEKVANNLLGLSTHKGEDLWYATSETAFTIRAYVESTLGITLDRDQP